MKNLVEYCNEALTKKNARYAAAEEVSKKILKWVSDKSKDKDYKEGNEYNSDLQVEYHDSDARIKVGKYDDIYAYPGDKVDLKDGQCPKNVKVLVKFTQLLSREEGTKEAYQLLNTTNEATRDTIGRARAEVWYSPDKDQLYDAFFKKISSPGKSKSDPFETLFCSFISGINPDTQYTKEWFSK